MGAAVAAVRDNGRVGLYRDDGVVLRTQKLGEADRIVTVLARRTGRIRAVGKGVRRTKSRFGARLEPFTHVDLQLYTGRSLDVITQAETVRAYGEPLSADYPRYTSGTAMLETAERFTPVRRSRRCASSCCWSVGCGRWARQRTTRGWYSTPSCCARWQSPGTPPPWPSAPCAGPQTPAPAAMAAAGQARRAAGHVPSRSRPAA